MIIKHIHANVGIFNGSLYFTVDNRLLRVGVSTPNYNDYNEWRLDEWCLSKDPYNPDGNQIELSPYKFIDIEINNIDLKMLEYSSSLSDLNNEYEIDSELIKSYSDIDLYLSGIKYSNNNRMSIYIESKNDYINLDSFDESKETPFQKVFFKILEGFRNGFKQKIIDEEENKIKQKKLNTKLIKDAFEKL